MALTEIENGISIAMNDHYNAITSHASVFEGAEWIFEVVLKAKGIDTAL